MQFGNYANVVTLAAALSMAGWVARTPDNPQDFPVNFNNQFTNSHSNRFHPYSQPQGNNWAENFNNQNFGPMVQQPVLPPNNFQQYGRNELYQSKEAEENFRAHMELQELISWQESYRRGDLPLGQATNEQYVMPVAQNGKTRERTSTDDGYVSAMGSPASSTVSGIANEIDEISTASSPPPTSGDSVFDNLDFHAQTPFSHISDQHSTFDIDEILDTDDKDFSPESTFTDTKQEEPKVPFSKLISSLDEGLDYIADSPLKSPGADSFFSRLSPEYNPPSYTTNKYDPFQMQFSNSSMPEKYLADTLVDIADFDPSFFENAPQTDEEMDKALVQSLAKSNDVSIKTEDEFSNIGSPMVEHDYSKEDFLSPKPTSLGQGAPRYPPTEFQRPKNHLVQRPSARAPPASPIPRRLTSRTFAPAAASSERASIKKTATKVKEEKEKSRLLWKDFPFSTDQIINMPVEKFNEVIKQLDEIRQHIAKDVRRKGKNKLAARNCRKRKMDVIDNLDNGISHLEQQRETLLEERKKILEETRQLQQKTEWLNQYIFEHLRDDNGLPYSTNDFSLQYTADGNVYLVPTNQVQV